MKYTCELCSFSYLDYYYIDVKEGNIYKYYECKICKHLGVNVIWNYKDWRKS